MNGLSKRTERACYASRPLSWRVHAVMTFTADGNLIQKPPVEPAIATTSLTDDVTRWMSKLLGYASLVAACGGIAKYAL